MVGSSVFRFLIKVLPVSGSLLSLPAVALYLWCLVCFQLFYTLLYCIPVRLHCVNRDKATTFQVASFESGYSPGFDTLMGEASHTETLALLSEASGSGIIMM